MLLSIIGDRMQCHYYLFFLFSETLQCFPFLSGSPYDCIVASLGVHTLVGHGVSDDAAVANYEKAFKLVLSALKPGGHFIYGDHVGILPLYRHI